MWLLVGRGAALQLAKGPQHTPQCGSGEAEEAGDGAGTASQGMTDGGNCSLGLTLTGVPLPRPF